MMQNSSASSTHGQVSSVPGYLKKSVLVLQNEGVDYFYMVGSYQPEFDLPIIAVSEEEIEAQKHLSKLDERYATETNATKILVESESYSEIQNEYFKKVIRGEVESLISMGWRPRFLVHNVGSRKWYMMLFIKQVGSSDAKLPILLSQLKIPEASVKVISAKSIGNIATSSIIFDPELIYKANKRMFLPPSKRHLASKLLTTRIEKTILKKSAYKESYGLSPSVTPVYCFSSYGRRYFLKQGAHIVVNGSATDIESWCRIAFSNHPGRILIVGDIPNIKLFERFVPMNIHHYKVGLKSLYYHLQKEGKSFLMSTLFTGILQAERYSRAIDQNINNIFSEAGLEALGKTNVEVLEEKISQKKISSLDAEVLLLWSLVRTVTPKEILNEGNNPRWSRSKLLSLNDVRIPESPFLLASILLREMFNGLPFQTVLVTDLQLTKKMLSKGKSGSLSTFEIFNQLFPEISFVFATNLSTEGPKIQQLRLFSYSKHGKLLQQPVFYDIDDSKYLVHSVPFSESRNLVLKNEVLGSVEEMHDEVRNSLNGLERYLGDVVLPTPKTLVITSDEFIVALEKEKVRIEILILLSGGEERDLLNSNPDLAEPLSTLVRQSLVEQIRKGTSSSSNVYKVTPKGSEYITNIKLSASKFIRRSGLGFDEFFHMAKERYENKAVGGEESEYYMEIINTIVMGYSICVLQERAGFTVSPTILALLKLWKFDYKVKDLGKFTMALEGTTKELYDSAIRGIISPRLQNANDVQQSTPARRSEPSSRKKVGDSTLPVVKAEISEGIELPEEVKVLIRNASVIHFLEGELNHPDFNDLTLSQLSEIIETGHLHTLSSDPRTRETLKKFNLNHVNFNYLVSQSDDFIRTLILLRGGRLPEHLLPSNSFAPFDDAIIKSISSSTRSCNELNQMISVAFDPLIELWRDEFNLTENNALLPRLNKWKDEYRNNYGAPHSLSFYNTLLMAIQDVVGELFVEEIEVDSKLFGLPESVLQKVKFYNFKRMDLLDLYYKQKSLGENQETYHEMVIRYVKSAIRKKF